MPPLVRLPYASIFFSSKKTNAIKWFKGMRNSNDKKSNWKFLIQNNFLPVYAFNNSFKKLIRLKRLFFAITTVILDSIFSYKFEASNKTV